jgi:pilus assembly protein CpaE
MNAPWKPNGSAREIFQAYVCDDASASIIRSIAMEMGWEPDLVFKGGLRNAIQSLSITPSPNILFVDISETTDPLNDINGLAEVCEPGTVVIAAGPINDVRLYRDLVASGLQDYLLKPLNSDHLRESLANAQAAFMAPRLETSTERPHLPITVIGTRGGVGASGFATSLAWWLSEVSKRSTALLDLDLHFGTDALTLDLEPGRGLIDAIDNPSRIDGLFIERAMVRANERLAILSAEAPISQPLLTDGGAFYQLQEEFSNAFECSIIDLPRPMLIQYPQLMASTAATVLVTDLTLAAARDSIRILAWMKTYAPQSTVIIVANKVQPNALEISRKDFEQSIERKIDVMLPFDARLAAQAAKLGKSLAEVGKSTKLGQAYAEAGKLILAIGEEEGALGNGIDSGNSLLSKISEISALFKKEKTKIVSADTAV